MSVEHAEFVVERTYPHPPSRVFAAWADPAVKRRWAVAAGGEHELDFRVGGRETARDGTPGGPGFHTVTIYRDIVPDERIVYTYDLFAGDELVSVSVTSVILAPDGGGTRLTLTEQIAVLDGRDTPQAREAGMRSLIDAIARVL